jgi:hypothetical protein
MRSHGERMSDVELLEKLQTFGVTLNRDAFHKTCERSLSAQEIAEPLVDTWLSGSRRDEIDGDWIWICLVALWKRWFPDIPSFEILDDKIQSGYDDIKAKRVVAGLRTWLDAWNDVRALSARAGIESIKEFDKQFGGTQSLYNWVQDLEQELLNGGSLDPSLYRARIDTCEEALALFPAEDALLTENMRRAIAESSFELGDAPRADALFAEWLRDDPQWGWGWIGWSDLRCFCSPELRDLNWCERILMQGFETAGVRNRDDIADRLADLYEDLGRADEAAEFRALAKDGQPLSTGPVLPSDGPAPSEAGYATPSGRHIWLPEPPLPAPATHDARVAKERFGRKIGRNEMCPCGSGRKYKRCCA